MVDSYFFRRTNPEERLNGQKRAKAEKTLQSNMKKNQHGFQIAWKKNSRVVGLHVLR